MTHSVHGRHRPQAFTLVELLVVIGIIGLLISILLPSLNKARAAADSAKCANTLRQFMNADAMYVADYRSFHLPAYMEFNPAVTNLGAGARASNIWPANTAFRKYLKFRDWHPSAAYTTDFTTIVDFTNNQGTTAANNAFVPDGFVCPAATRLLTNVQSDNWGQQWFPVITQYGMNVQGLYATPTFTDPQDGTTKTNMFPYTIKRTGATPAGDGVFAYKASKVRNPAEKLRFVDAMTTLAMVDASGSGVGCPNGDVSKGTGGKLSNYDIVKEYTGTGTIPGAGAYNANMMTVWRHRGGANVAFFDGHVAWLKKDEIYSVDGATGKISINWRLWKPMDAQ